MCSRNRNAPEENLAKVGAEVDGVTEDISSLRVAQIDDKFNAPSHMQNVIVRHYVMEWENSLNGLANYPENAEWRPLDGHYDIFQSSTRYKQGTVRRSKFRQGDLEQAILIGMKVKKVTSNFPVKLGLQVEGCKGNYYTCNGERYAYMINSNEQSNSLDEIVVTSSPYVNSEYLRMYPGMTKQNLRANGIMNVPGENYVFVDHQHPIVEMMSENQDVLQIDLKNADLIDGRWYKVSKAVTERCLSELENELVENLPLLNLSKFNAKIVRPYGKRWDDPSGWGENVDPQTRERVVNTTRSCSVVIQLTYAFA
jgi:hypothetical protein